MTLDQMRYVLKQMEIGCTEKLGPVVCLYLANGACLTGWASIVDDDNDGTGLVQVEGHSVGVVAFVEVEEIAAVKLVVPDDVSEGQVEHEERVEH